MKLIVREYLASLKERNELDAILPDLLSELGLTVFSRPGRGTRQDGVDVAAVGKLLDSEDEKVYLLSIKSGDLTRSSWDGDALQSLRPSLNEIIDTYIPNRLPNEHRNKPIVICLCFGGDIKEQVRPQVEGYITNNKKDGLEFEEWNGDKLADFILSSFLKEDLMPVDFRSSLRKSLSLIDEPDVSFKHFSTLIESICDAKKEKDSETITAIRQLNICLWILYTWCREQGNLESAYLCSERALLSAWDLCKSFIEKDTKPARLIRSAIDGMHLAYQMITAQYLEEKILPHVDKKHGLSSAIRPSCKVDVNLKLFDILGRLAMGGVWVYWLLQRCSEKDTDHFRILNDQYATYCKAIKQLISNNPALFLPYKDDQGIDVSIAAWILSLDTNNHSDIETWLSQIISIARFNFDTHGNYPSNIYSYTELIEHPAEKSDEYREDKTAGSILYPLISIISSLLGFEEVYNEIKDFKLKSLAHCNFQVWYPDSESENNYYKNSSNHGAVLSGVWVDKNQDELIDQVFKECGENSCFEELSAVKYNLWPLIFLASRHYRIPVPIHFFQGFRSDN